MRVRYWYHLSAIMEADRRDLEADGRAKAGAYEVLDMQRLSRIVRKKAPLRGCFEGESKKHGGPFLISRKTLPNKGPASHFPCFKPKSQSLESFQKGHRSSSALISSLIKTRDFERPVLGSFLTTGVSLNETSP